MPYMSRSVRDIFILSGLIAVYGLAVWLYEAKLATAFGDSFAETPHAKSALHDRDILMAQELHVPAFTPPADDMLAVDGVITEGIDA